MGVQLSREELQDLANKPIGNRSLQKSGRGTEKLSDQTSLEAAKRASKLWLPLGRRSPGFAKEANLEAAARQIDIEDSIEQAGGARGSINKA